MTPDQLDQIARAVQNRLLNSLDRDIQSATEQLGITEAQSAHAAKRVSDRMRQAVRDLLREEGVPAAGLEAAVAEVLALVEESSDG